MPVLGYPEPHILFLLQETPALTLPCIPGQSCVRLLGSISGNTTVPSLGGSALTQCCPPAPGPGHGSQLVCEGLMTMRLMGPSKEARCTLLHLTFLPR